MKTKLKEQEDKKGIPSVYIIAPLVVMIFLVAAYLTCDTCYPERDLLDVNISNRITYGKSTKITFEKLDPELYCVATFEPYVFSSEEPTVELLEEEVTEEVYVEPTPQVYVDTSIVPPEAMGDASVDAILANYGLTYEQFYTVVAIVASEGGGSYEDAYAVASTIFNRTRCSRWVYSAYNQGIDGKSMFGQATLPNQYTVYQSGSYLNHMYEVGTNAYNAVVTLLTTGIPMHNYLSFRSANSGAQGVQFVPGGNIYFTELQAYEII